MITILQISDLHRDPRNPLRNDALLISLENDRHRYTAQPDGPIARPDIIIVSGNVIQGAAPGSADFERTLSEQHDEALGFLVDERPLNRRSSSSNRWSEECRHVSSAPSVRIGQGANAFVMARFHILLTSHQARPTRTLSPAGVFRRLGAVLAAIVLVSVVIGILLVGLFIGSILAAFLITLVVVVSTVARIRMAVQRRNTERDRVAPHHMEERRSWVRQSRSRDMQQCRRRSGPT